MMERVAMTEKCARIKPIGLDELNGEQLAVFGGTQDPRCELNFFKVLIQHPSLLKAYTPFAMQLGRNPTIPLRDKEILILRTLTICNEEYELAHHDIIAREAGMTDTQIKAAKAGEATSDLDRILIKAAEELVSGRCVSDETWLILTQHYSAQQLIELVFMVANYVMLAMLNNSLGIYPEDDVDSTWKPTDKP